MKRLLALALLAVAVFGALSYHFILTRDGLILERKEELSFEDTFVDARPWGSSTGSSIRRSRGRSRAAARATSRKAPARPSRRPARSSRSSADK